MIFTQNYDIFYKFQFFHHFLITFYSKNHDFSTSKYFYIFFIICSIFFHLCISTQNFVEISEKNTSIFHDFFSSSEQRKYGSALFVYFIRVGTQGGAPNPPFRGHPPV